MLSYTFKARNDEGSLIAGGMRATCRETAITALKKKGYFILSVETQNRLFAAFGLNSYLRNRVSLRTKAIFTNQLATLLKAGVRLTTALRTLSEQTEDKYLSSVTQQLYGDIERSSSLSEAMSKHPRVFSPVYTAIVKAAEESGTLSETLAALSEQMKSQASAHARVRAALVYPIFLLVVSAAVVAILTTFVVPKFVELFINTNQALPLPTRILVGTTNYLKESWWVILSVVTVIGVVASAVVRNKHVKLTADTLLLKIPTIGTISQKLQLARFTRTLGSLLQGGVRIASAVDIARAVTTNSAFAQEIRNIEQAILKGVSLAEAMNSQQHFTKIAASMIAVGEESGTLPEMLLEVAEIYDQECESTMSSLTSILGPSMIVILGLIIGFVVMGILLPIFETSTMMR